MLGHLLLAFCLVPSGWALLVNLTSSSDQARDIIKHTKFDYIIVGGGTAGLTVAQRLTESSNTKVLVLEAGRSGVGDELVTVPERSFSFIATDIDWLYSTVPQTHGAKQQINLSQGKVLGGDSAVNGLVWNRGAKSEYDAFEKLGSPSWNWESLYSFMRKTEKLNPPSAALTSEFGFNVDKRSLGTSGPTDVSFPDFLPVHFQKLVEASVEVGHDFNKDAYSGHPNGVYYSLSSQTARASRETSELANENAIVKRPNLVVFMHALVTKLELDCKGRTPTATGVHVRFPDGSDVLASTKGEVILSAGTVRTPQLLELSGIGDPKVLKPHGIDVKVDLPGVGNNYEDHPLVLLTYKLKPGFLSFDALSFNATLKAEQTELYEDHRQGWFTFTQGVVNVEPIEKVLSKSDIAEAKKMLAKKPAGIPQDQFNIIKDGVFGSVPQVEYILFNSFSAGNFTTKEANASYFSVSVTGLHPLSRGSIHINTTSIDQAPLIDPQLLQADFDTWFLGKAAAFARKLILNTKAFKDIVDPVEVFPGAQVQTEAQWNQYVKDNINAGYHSIGSASLLPRSKNGVVDSSLRVYGVQNLRVADVSIMPSHVSSHTQTAAYAIGEKAAVIIKSKHY